MKGQFTSRRNWPGYLRNPAGLHNVDIENARGDRKTGCKKDAEDSQVLLMSPCGWLIMKYRRRVFPWKTGFAQRELSPTLNSTLNLCSPR